MNTCIVSIVSANYLAYARVLAESIREHEPEITFELLVVDRRTPEIESAVKKSGLSATFAEELALTNFEALAFKFDLVEFNTALKPTFLKRQFAKGFDSVIYLDPDIRLYRALTPINAALAANEIVLIPHALAPALDGKRPSDIDFLRNGAYNLGFIALRRGSESSKLLDWWEARCLEYGFNDLGFGVFVDQKWMDLVPSFFGSVCVLRDPGCNVAYWNLHERQIVGEDGQWLVGGRPLVFFHFSGVKADSPNVLSRHQTRHELVAGSPLAAMVTDYCNALWAQGHRDFARLSYTFGSFDNGAAISGFARRASTFHTSEASPFLGTGPLYSQLTSSGFIARAGMATGKTAAGTSTLDFNTGDRRVRIVNACIRGLARLLGVERLSTLLRYAAFVARESNLARVLMREPFDLQHGRRQGPDARRDLRH